jgi:hypothetical protein
MIAAGKTIVDKLIADGMPVTLAADLLAAVKSAVIELRTRLVAADLVF